jgi:hypothetical protein
MRPFFGFLLTGRQLLGGLLVVLVLIYCAAWLALKLWPLTLLVVGLLLWRRLR